MLVEADNSWAPLVALPLVSAEGSSIGVPNIWCALVLVFYRIFSFERVPYCSFGFFRIPLGSSGFYKAPKCPLGLLPFS